jgi:hypothetical protein
MEFITMKHILIFLKLVFCVVAIIILLIIDVFAERKSIQTNASVSGIEIESMHSDETEFFSSFMNDDQILELGCSVDIFSFPFYFDEVTKNRYRHGIFMEVVVADPTVVSVMGNQRIYATGPGSSLITVKDRYGTIISEFLVTVLQQEMGWDYRIGAIGPGGGVIFHDKGDYSSGWRYLEVAPDYWNGKGYDQQVWWHNIPFEMFKQVKKDTFSNTSSDIGSGKENTRIIVEEMGPDGGYAALLCYDLVLHGKDDWFLPSLGELELLFALDYEKVHLSGTEYWSSTSAGNPFDVKTIDARDKTILDLAVLNEAYCRPIRVF